MYEEAIEIVDLVAWRLAFDLAVEEVANIFVVEHVVLNSHNGPANLPISLAIQLICANIRCARLVSGVQADHVCWDALVGIDLDDVTDSDVLCHDFSYDTGVAVQPLVLLLIQQLVPLSPFIVLVEFLDHGYGQHKNERRQIRNEETNSKCLNELREAHQQEEQVEEVLELVEQNDREEREERVPLVVYLVVRNTAQHEIKVIEFDRAGLSKCETWMRSAKLKRAEDFQIDCVNLPSCLQAACRLDHCCVSTGTRAMAVR